MTGAVPGVLGNIEEMAGAERRLAATLLAASDDVAHCECLDAEERAEVYAILEAIRADTDAHYQAVGFLSHLLSQETGDA